MEDTTSTRHDPSPILQTAFAFWSSKVLLTAVEMGLFTKLGDRRLTGKELGAEMELHPRGISDFFDALVAMKFLAREALLQHPCRRDVPRSEEPSLRRRDPRNARRLHRGGGCGLRRGSASAVRRPASSGAAVHQVSTRFSVMAWRSTKLERSLW